MDARLKESFNAVLVSSGNLLSHIYTYSNQRVIPNPPTILQASIDIALKGYHRILDEVDIEIQLSRQYIKNAMEEQRMQKLKEQQEKEQAAKELKAKEELEKVKKEEAEIKKEEENKPQEEKSVETNEQKTEEEGTKSEEKEKDVNGVENFDSNMEFDEDLNALLGSVGQRQEGDMDNGLFGDEFDFLMNQ
ncbi:hypothetical protein TRVA0_009S01332 [Trichomonascus vanleenenianus]|uniref:uncharacterized protein n=1 Tax=Trichomonascus vanleenenianus TaxID=2268995 RepID=UPI003EC98DEB